ncbi:MAG: substrate-binding domain-containing protein [Vulcanimicrobiota bacterium]
MNKRRAMSHLLVWILFLSALPAYTGSGCAAKHSLSPDSITEITEDYKTPVVAVVPKCTTMAYWHSVRVGAESAGKKLGVEVAWSGPESELDVEEQKRILEKFIEDKVNAIVFSACDPEALVETARRAKAEGIVVVLIDSGINDDTVAVSFAATDNVEAGHQAGHKLAQLIDKKGQVGLIPIIHGVNSSDDREKGFKEAISCYPAITLGPVIYSESTIDRGRAAAESMLSGYPDLKGIFAANEYGGVGAAEAIKKRKCAGKVKLVAFDSSEPEVNALKAGIIQALIIQDPVNIGFEGVKQAVDAMNGRPVNKNVTTGVKIITTEEINQPLP